MPLRATSDNGDLQSFELDSAQWAELKGHYKRLNLRMPCCQVAAVPKTSTLGNYFFAHARRGECTTAPESVEHLYCKALIAKAAASAGWTVTTERAGVSPGGEAWVADVFCEKGSAQVALEVQMSPQPREEAYRRQARYKSSSVRAAWFYGEKLRKDLTATTRALPIFGLAKVELGQEPNVGVTELALSDFVVALLRKRVTWMQYAPTEPFYLAVLRRDCSHCHKPAGLVYGHARTESGLPYGALVAAEIESALERVSEAMTNVELESLGLCHLAHFHQAKTHRVRLLNSCPHCGVLFKNERVDEHIGYAAQAPTQPSGLDHIFFDRQARDSGTWVLISEDGGYQAIADLH